MEKGIRNVEILRIFASGSCERTTDEVLEEIPLTLEVDGKEEASVVLSEGNEQNWALGHLACCRKITSIDDVDHILYEKGRIRVFRKVKRKGVTLTNKMIHKASSGLSDAAPMKDTSSSPLHIEWTVTLPSLIKAVRDIAEAPLFSRTGCLHVALLASVSGEILFRVEDIGRHNAVDKAVGWALANRIDMGKCFMVLSGRLPEDMVCKGIGAGIPLLVSVSAVTASGIDAAVRGGITLAGFARNGRINVYSFPERISF